MGVAAASEIGLHAPILQVVARPLPGAREVGDFVPLEAQLREALDGVEIELDNALAAGNRAGPVTAAARAQFLAQAALVVDFQHVNRNVIDCETVDPRQRFFPCPAGLMRQAGDEIDRNVADAAPAQPRDIRADRLRIVAPAGRAGDLGDE